MPRRDLQAQAQLRARSAGRLMKARHRVARQAMTDHD
jgi:hypothetical protein